MSENFVNVGQITGSQFQLGQNNVMYLPAQPTAPAERASWDVGIITVLSEESRAVAAMLSDAGVCEIRVHDSGLRFREAKLSVARSNISVVATQTLNQGQRSAVIAFERLREIYAPATVVLTGIAGAIHPSLDIGDVVVVDTVVYYDQRRETATGPARRGQACAVPARTKHAINAFFADRSEPYLTTIHGPDGISRACSVSRGPIGSGEAVIADGDSAIRRYISAFNDKTLAVETEAAGVAEAFYETTDSLAAGTGWLAIRGISDKADAAKSDASHEMASWHAAAILREMLPYLHASPMS